MTFDSTTRCFIRSYSGLARSASFLRSLITTPAFDRSKVDSTQQQRQFLRRNLCTHFTVRLRLHVGRQLPRAFFQTLVPDHKSVCVPEQNLQPIPVRFRNTKRKPLSGSCWTMFSTIPHSPSKLRRISAGCVQTNTRMPPVRLSITNHLHTQHQTPEEHRALVESENQQRARVPEHRKEAQSQSKLPIVHPRQRRRSQRNCRITRLQNSLMRPSQNAASCATRKTYSQRRRSSHRSRQSSHRKQPAARSTPTTALPNNAAA